jgi:hypothetical protein
MLLISFRDDDRDADYADDEGSQENPHAYPGEGRAHLPRSTGL